MQYHRVKRTDGGVSIIGLIPQAINGVRIPRIADFGNTKRLYAEDGTYVEMLTADFEAGRYPPEWKVDFEPVASEIAKWVPEQQALVVDHAPVAHADIPSDRTFRNAWTPTATSIDVDMVKARDIQRQRLRQLRAPLLEALDLEFMQALEKGQDTTAIVAKKQALRDVTADPAIEAAQTPEILKAVVPAILMPPVAKGP